MTAQALEVTPQASDSSSSEELTVRLSRQIRATPQRVWDVISSVEGMRQWLGPKTFEPQLGGRVLFDVLHGTNSSGEPQRWLMFGNISSWNERQQLAFTWQEFDVPSLICWPASTTVSISLEGIEGGTLVTLSHSGFEGLPDAIEQFNGYHQGWTSLNDLESLARMCEEE